MILNIGCGEEFYGDVRVDFVKTGSTTIVADLNNKFPFKSNQFDEIYCRSVLEHIKNLGQFIEESMRVLKKDGKFYFRTDNASYIGFIMQNHQSYIANEKWSRDDKHYYLFKPEHMINLFGENAKINFACPSKKLFFLPKKYKCMHLEITGRNYKGGKTR